MRFLPSAYVSFVLFLLIMALCMGRAPVFDDPDTAWHLAAGDLIRSLHGLPFDSWSFTTTGQRWYNLSWLFDILFSLLFDHGGFGALYALTIAVFAGCLTFMAYICVARGASPVVVFIFTLCVMFIIYVGVLARPNMCSVALTLLFYNILYSYRTSSKFLPMLLLPVLMALWVNLHGGFLLAFPIMGLFALEALIEKNRTHRRAYAFIIALCLGATLINPYGFELFYGAWRTLTGTFDRTNINEWMPVKVGEYIPMTALLLLLLSIGNAFDRRIALIDRMLAIMMLMLALSSVRHSVIAALLIMPYATQRLTFLFYESRLGKNQWATDRTFLEDMHLPALKIMGAVLAVAAVLFISLPYPRGAVLPVRMGFPLDDYPGDEAIYIDEHYPGVRFLNHYNLGGYLDYLWRGRQKVFIDGRASSLFSEEVLEDYVDFIDSKGFGGRADTIASQYHIGGLIIPNNITGAGDWLWNMHWKPVYRGPVATVYIRSDLVAR